MLTKEFLVEKNCLGFFRNLETNKRIVLPTNTHLCLLVTATDVLHSWAVPSFGIKIDACPGRFNQVNLFIKRFGLFYGQCSEICGVNHGFMPISLFALPSKQFYFFLYENLVVPAPTAAPALTAAPAPAAVSAPSQEVSRPEEDSENIIFGLDMKDIYDTFMCIFVVSLCLLLRYQDQRYRKYRKI